jgi:hypothetical protein
MLRTSGRRSLMRGWRVLGALAICTSLSCRVRKLEEEQSAPVLLTSQAINAPEGIASQPPSFGRRPHDSAAGNGDVAPAVLLAPGFGEAEFGAVRQAQIEAMRLLAGLNQPGQPWGGLAGRLDQLLERRWPDSFQAEATPIGQVGVDLFAHGNLRLPGPEMRPTLDRALSALNIRKVLPDGDQRPPSYDWASASGPLVVLARNSHGEMGAFWFNQASSDDNAPTVYLTSRSTDSASVAVICSCPTSGPTLLGARKLVSLLDAPASLNEQVVRLGNELRDAAQDERFGVLVLSDHGVLAATNPSLAYGVAGSVTAIAAPPIPPTKPPAPATPATQIATEPAREGARSASESATHQGDSGEARRSDAGTDVSPLSNDGQDAPKAATPAPTDPPPTSARPPSSDANESPDPGPQSPATSNEPQPRSTPPRGQP